MRYFIYCGFYHYTTDNKMADEFSKIAKEVTRAEWNEMKRDYKEAYGSLETFAKEMK